MSFADQIFVNNQHITSEKTLIVYGKSLFASINTHEKQQASRRDDLESALYILLLFYSGNFFSLSLNS